MRCAAITKGGSGCRLEATRGSSYCWSHDPANAEARKQRARRGGVAGGNGRPGPSDLKDIQGEIRAVIDGVLKGRVEKGAGSVAVQGYNVLLRLIETQRKLIEQDELLERLKRLEEIAENEEKRKSWH